MTSNLKIGELAVACGVSRDTVRYYERLKLLPRAARTRGGYRMYGGADVERVRFIKKRSRPDT
jgi:DNA-binding transcriptional MerR regulator